MDASSVTAPAPVAVLAPADARIASPSALPTGWLRRFWFRFGALYLALYHIDGLVAVFGLDWFSTDSLFWRKVVPWVGAHVLHLPQPITIFPNGSGDTTYNYVHIWCLLVTALLGASGWSLGDRERRADPLVGAGLRVLLRYVLAGTMLSYGVAKLFHQQMSAPSLARLVQPYGESSPMGLLWTFMGQSAGYSAFAGLAEIVPALLLLFRRTALLGAVLTAAVMANVVMMNFCFDVPVKIYSSHLLLAAVVLTASDARRLWDVFVAERPTAAPNLARTWARAWHRPAVIALKVLVVGAVVYSSAWDSAVRWRQELVRPKPELYGLYDVREFSADGTIVPPLLTESRRWRYMIMADHGLAIIFRMDGTRASFRVKMESAAGTLTLTPVPRPGAGEKLPPPATLRYTRSASGALELAGRYDGRELLVRGERVDESKFLLVNRGFRWVNEYPFNR